MRLLFLLALLLLSATIPRDAFSGTTEEARVSRVRSEGTTFDQPPELLPGGLPPESYLPQGSLDSAVHWFRHRDPERARRELEVYFAEKSKRDGSWIRANYLYAYLNMIEGDFQLASLHFYRVRTTEHPLAVFALYYEALVDFQRGKYVAAIPECEQYRERFPNGPHFDDCTLLIADAHREAGRAGTAIALYKEYEASHEEENIEERIQVAIARAYEVAGNTDVAIRMYTSLMLHHRYANHGDVAEEGLLRMREAGHDVPELTDEQKWSRANTLKHYRFDEAYALFTELWEQYEGQPDSEFFEKLEDNKYKFQLATRQYSKIAHENVRKFESLRGKSAAAEYLARAIRGFNKVGDFTNAAKYAEIARTQYRRSGHFGGVEQDLAWYYTNGADYANAHDAWARCYRDKPSSGFYRWMTAYGAYRAEKYEEAIDALTPLVNAGGTHALSARFFRAKCHLALDHTGSARADFNVIQRDHPDDWYSQVIESRKRRARRDERPVGVARDGRWPAPDHLDLPAPPDAPPERDLEAVYAALLAGTPEQGGARTLPTPSTPLDVDGRPLAPSGMAPGDETSVPAAAVAPGGDPSEALWSQMEWPYPAGEPAPPMMPIEPASTHVRYPVVEVGQRYDRDRALASLARFAESHEEVWPLLPAIYEITALGFRGESGQYIARVYEEIGEARKSGKIRRKLEEYEKELEEAAKTAETETETETEAEAEAETGTGTETEAEEEAEEAEEAENKALLPPLRDEERWARMLELRTDALAWRDLFILTEAPHHMAKASSGAYRLAADTRDDPDALLAWRQAYPLAYGERVWELCERFDVDPMLVFGLMRIESVYHPTVVSRAGATGVMQIMPGTGSRVSRLSGYGSYSDELLRDPEANVYFGIWYLSRLMDRYDDQFPLAVGSYNGGPHNIGRWLRSKHNVGLEEFVEEIPFNETRKYTKRVTQMYATYLSIYDPEAYVQLPRTTRPDNPKVINF